MDSKATTGAPHDTALATASPTSSLFILSRVKGVRVRVRIRVTIRVTIRVRVIGLGHSLV